MIITYARSSSIGTLSFCEMKYFCVYNLGLKDKENVKAMMGTIIHRVMQVLADKKLAQEQKLGKVINDDIPNLSYKKCDDIPYVTKLCFDYYKSHSEIGNKLGPKELKTCIDWVNRAITYNDGDLDPRNQNIYATELFFDVEIKQPWAKYEYTIGDEKLSGFFSIKGTVDLILQENDRYYHILDYKSGRRYDWGTETVKTPKKLKNDTQLLLYYYALRNMYPDKEFFVSIYYINNYQIDGEMVKGGLYSMVFDDTDYEKSENILRQKFEYIRSVELPRQLDPRHNHFKCKYLCKFSEPWENSEESTCNFMHRMIQSQGIEKTIAEYGDVGKIKLYGSGGGRLDTDDKTTIKTV